MTVEDKPVLSLEVFSDISVTEIFEEVTKNECTIISGVIYIVSHRLTFSYYYY